MKTTPGQGVAARPVVSKWLHVDDALAGGGVIAGSPARALPPDEVLVARLRDRDEAIFALLIDAWSTGMRRLARFLVSTDDSAAAIVRDTWLAVIQDIGTFDGRLSLKSWVHRLLVDTAKRRGAREGHGVGRRPMSEPADHGPTVDPTRFQDPSEPYPGHWREFPALWPPPKQGTPPADTRAQVTAALAQLPAHEQLVVTLIDAEGFSPDEVCFILNISAASQCALLHRARALIRRRLEDYFALVSPEDETATS